MLLLTAFCSIALLLHQTSAELDDDRSTYVCLEGKCMAKISLEKTSSTFQSMESCRLMCGEYGNLWPLPTSAPKLGNKLILINPTKISLHVHGSAEAKKYLKKAYEIFVDNLVLECGQKPISPSDTKIHITIKVKDQDVTLSVETIEDYELRISFTSGEDSSDFSIKIHAKTVFGARHALETLSQLTSRVYHRNSSCDISMIDSATVVDKPAFKHRGLLIDTSRHFIPVEDLKRTIRAMSANKLNVLHWHATDSHSFPLLLSKVPSLARLGAYSAEEIYDEKDITDLVDYAKHRGIRILMEIDSPAHAGNGWQFGEKEGLGKLVLCRNYSPWSEYCLQPPCGQLNPANQNIYKVLGEIYKNLQSLMPTDEMFHMGGDEVCFECWKKSEDVQIYMKNKGYHHNKKGYMKLWAEFHAKALDAWDKAIGHSNTKIVLWSSDLTDPTIINTTLDKNRFIISTWTNSHDGTPVKLANLGYDVIYVTVDTWYLDSGFNSGEYHTWRTVYDNQIPNHPKVLGGQAALWTEYADSNSLDTRLWPRVAALAERLWSAPSTYSGAATYRLLEARERLIRRGIHVDQIIPEWCYLNEDLC